MRVGRGQIIQRWERLVFYKSVNTLWIEHFLLFRVKLQYLQYILVHTYCLLIFRNKLFRLRIFLKRFASTSFFVYFCLNCVGFNWAVKANFLTLKFIALLVYIGRGGEGGKGRFYVFGLNNVKNPHRVHDGPCDGNKKCCPPERALETQ